MQPQVDIKKIRDRYFNYSVSIGYAAECYAREGLRSIGECLHDSATALGHHFPIAIVSYEGRLLGRYAVAAMEHKTVQLERTLVDLLAVPDIDV